jgi:CDP-diacylglycerol--serine O-phosphatidyltransferase
VFGIKDLFTLGNLLSGFAVILLAWEGRIEWAAAAVFVGYVFDALDGMVARLMRSGNRFGAELDNVADLVTYSVAPSFVVFAAYRPMNEALAAVLAVFPALCGALRFARFNVQRIEFPGYWVGLPRPASAVFVVSFCASSTFAEPAVACAGIALLPFVTLMNLSLIPFHGHHRRASSPSFVVAVSLWVGSTALSIPLGLLFEACLFWSSAYSFLQYFFIPATDRARIREFVREWRRGQARERLREGPASR